MPFYRHVGEIPPKRHTRFAKPDGGLYAEELMGEEGFSFDSALLYHRHPPTKLVAVEGVEGEVQELSANHPLRPRHFRTHELKAGGDIVTGRHLLLANDDCRLSYVSASDTSELTKNAMGDEMVFIEEGEGTIETMFGAMTFSKGDYVIVPASTIHRWVLGGQVRALVLETRAHIGPPRRYLSRNGQFLEHAPYCERDIRGPGEPLLVSGTDVDVYLRHWNGTTRYRYAHHPFDVVGWDGCLYPWIFSIYDFEPITGRIHQPPPVHQVFEAPNQVRLPPRRHPRALQPLQRRLGRGALLRRRQLHEPQGQRHRSRLGFPPSRGAHPRPAARVRRSEPRRRGDRGVRRHDRHVPPARSRPRGPR